MNIQRGDEAEARTARSCVLVVTGDSDKIYEVDWYLLCSLFKIAIKVLQIDIIDE